MPNPSTRPLERGLLFTSGDILLLGISDDAAVQLRDGLIIRGLDGCRFDLHHFRFPDYADNLWRVTPAGNIPPGSMCAHNGEYYWKLGLAERLYNFVSLRGDIVTFSDTEMLRTSAWRLVRQ